MTAAFFGLHHSPLALTPNVSQCTICASLLPRVISATRPRRQQSAVLPVTWSASPFEAPPTLPARMHAGGLAIFLINLGVLKIDWGRVER